MPHFQAVHGLTRGPRAGVSPKVPSSHRRCSTEQGKARALQRVEVLDSPPGLHWPAGSRKFRKGPGHPGTVARSRHTRAHFPWGSEPRAAQEARHRHREPGREGGASGGSRHLPAAIAASELSGCPCARQPAKTTQLC